MLMPAVSSSPGVQSCLTGVSSSLSDILYKPRANFCMLARFVAMPKGATPDPEEDFYFCTVLLMGASQSDATRAEVVAPAELRDEENTTQPWSSEVVKARLVRMAPVHMPVPARAPPTADRRPRIARVSRAYRCVRLPEISATDCTPCTLHVRVPRPVPLPCRRRAVLPCLRTVFASRRATTEPSV